MTITVANKQSHDDHLFLEIEGLDVEWYALPVPALNVPSGDTQSTKVLFKIPRTSDCHADTYPFIVRVKGLEAGQTGFQQGVLHVKPFHALQIDINPRRGVASYFGRSAVFEVTVSNLGNQEAQIDLYATEPEDACNFEFETSRVAVKPGHTANVPLAVEPLTRPALGSMRLYGISATARLVEDAYVSATAHAQLERRPLLSTAAALILLALVFGVTGWSVMRPKPVSISSFSASTKRITRGATLKLTWEIDHLGTGSTINPGGIAVTSASGNTEVAPEETTTYRLEAHGAGQTDIKDITVEVIPPPVIEPPKIVSFDTSATRVHAGDTVTLKWNLQNAKEVLLNPLGRKEEWPLFKSLDVPLTQTTTFELVARGLDNSVPVAQKSLKVEVVDVSSSIASINSFKVTKSPIEQGEKTTLSWSISGAVSLKVDNGVEATFAPQGKITVTPTQTTTYTLTAYDNKGNMTTKTVTVRVNPPKEVVPDNPDTSVQPTTTP